MRNLTVVELSSVFGGEGCSSSKGNSNHGHSNSNGNGGGDHGGFHTAGNVVDILKPAQDQFMKKHGVKYPPSNPGAPAGTSPVHDLQKRVNDTFGSAPNHKDKSFQTASNGGGHNHR
jgi:hypothetical protein